MATEGGAAILGYKSTGRVRTRLPLTSKTRRAGVQLSHSALRPEVKAAPETIGSSDFGGAGFRNLEPDADEYRPEYIHFDFYHRVRHACRVDGTNNSSTGRLFGINRKLIAKILKRPGLPTYRRATSPSWEKRDPSISVIDMILGEDKRRIKLQRHKASRVDARLRDDHAFASGITVVKADISGTQHP